MNILTWNTQWCCGLDGVVDPARIVRQARALGDFDVLCLQEIAINYPQLAGQPAHDQPALLRGLLPGFQVFFGAAVDTLGPDGRRQQFGNLIASRLPVHQVRHHVLPWPADAGVRSMQRMATEVTVATAWGPVRVITAHLEFYSARQRLAQARALKDIHVAACALAAAPPEQSRDGSPFQASPLTAEAVICGDFNAGRGAEYSLMEEPFEVPSAGDGAPLQGRLRECWPLLHGERPRPPTFQIHDRRHGPESTSCDFMFVSQGLASRLRRVQIDVDTQASDHQPVFAEFADAA